MGKISSDLVNTEFVTTENKDAVKLDEVGEPSDNTNLDTDASRHGLCPKLSGNSDDALRGDGTWGEVSGGSFTVIDEFNDSVLHPRWTKTEGGTVTVNETADGVEITVPAAETEQGYLDMVLPPDMGQRQWYAQVHITLEHTGSVVDTIYTGLRILGKGNNTLQRIRGYYYYSGSQFEVGKADETTTEDKFAASSGEIWIRLRRFDREIRLDWYEGPATTDPDLGGYWQEYDTALQIYQAPTSGTFTVPVLYETLRLEAYQWTNNPGMKAIFRNFKLRIF